MGVIGLIAEVIVLGGVVLGLCFNAAIVGSCDLLEVGRVGKFGPWREAISDPGECRGWNKDEVDTDWIINMARACSMMALVFGCLLLCYGFFQQYSCPLPFSQRIMDISATGVQISLALIWPVWRSDVCDIYSCSWGDSATSLLCAQLCYLASGIFSRCMREPRYLRQQNHQEDEGQQATLSVKDSSGSQVEDDEDDEDQEP